MFGMRGSLGRQLLLPLLLFEAVSLLIIGSIMLVSYQGQLSGTRRLQQEAATRAAVAVETFLKGFQDELIRAAASEVVVQDPEQGRQALGRLAVQSAYTTLAIVDSAGRERARLAPRPDAPALPENWAQHPALSSILIGVPYNSPAEFYGGLPYIVMAIPIRDAELRVVGMLAAQVELSSLWNVVSKEKSGETGYAYVIDRAANLIMARELEMVMRPPDVKGLVSVQAVLQNHSLPNAYRGLSGQDVIGNAQPVAGTDWTVIAELPTAEAYAALQWQTPLLVVWVLVGGGLAVGILFYANRRVVAPILEIQRGAQIIGGGDLAHRLTVKAGGELADLVEVFNGVTAQLQSLVGGLEQRVAERTRGLQTAAEVARATTSVLDPDELLRQTVDLVRERFNLYYVGLFLLDREGKFAVLRAGTGEAGRQMLERRHKLEVGGDSMIGQCTARAEARIALDVGMEAVRFSNPLLPETRSEMALPLRSRGRVIGAMTVQSVEEAAFDETDIAIMQTMADQVAVAIDNARLFVEAQTALQEMEATHRHYLGRAWTEYTAARAVGGYEQTRAGVKPLGGEMLPGALQAVTERQPVIWKDDPALSQPARDDAGSERGQRSPSGGGDTGQAGAPSPSALIVPIMLRGQPIGALGLKDEEGKGQWSAEGIALAEAVAQQFALAADNLRLLEETQRLAAREQTLNTIVARARAGLTLDQVLQAAVQQLGATLGAARVAVRLKSATRV